MTRFFSAQNVVVKYIASTELRTKQKNLNLFLKAFLSGVMIAMGAVASSVAAHTAVDAGTTRLITGLIFPVGLIMTSVTGAELFTGNCLLMMPALARKLRIMNLFRVMGIVYLGNFIGAVSIAVGTYLCGILDYSDGLLGAFMIKITMAKAELSFCQNIVSGILCNILVCVAVFMALCAWDIIGKTWAIYFPMMLFAIVGFEHCVANMYYFAMGLMVNNNPEYVHIAIERFGYSAERLEILTIKNAIFGNLLPVTIGNLIGGMIFVGFPMYYLHKGAVHEMPPFEEET